MRWLALLQLLPVAAHRLENTISCFTPEAEYWLAVSNGVRVSQYGFKFYHTQVTHYPGSQPCSRIIDGLCRHPNNYTFLPCKITPRTRITHAPEPFGYFWHHEAACEKVPTLWYYDITPCDLKHKDTTVLYADGRVSVLHDTEVPVWVRVAVGIVLIWLVINLGESVAMVVDPTTSHDTQNHTTVTLCLAIAGVILVYTPWAMWPTAEERLMYFNSVGYVILYCGYHLFNPNTINIIVGVLVLVTSRFYMTCDTPYVGAFMLVITTRLIQKGYRKTTTSVPDTARWAFMALDVAFVILLYVNAFNDTFHNLYQAPLYGIGMLFTAWCMGRFVAQL